MEAFYAGAALGMEKCAYGARQAQRVLSVAKKLQLPKASSRVAPGLSGAPSFKRGISDAMSGTGGLVKKEDFSSAMRAVPTGRLVEQSGRPVIMPGAGRSENQVRDTIRMITGVELPRVPKSQKKMLESILKGHELDETLVRGRIGAAHFGHRSPDVIYREHNRVATLPKKYDAVRKFMISLRGTAGEASLMPKGIEYGKGQRLSRHARKSLTGSRHNEGLNEFRSQMAQM